MTIEHISTGDELGKRFNYAIQCNIAGTIQILYFNNPSKKTIDGLYYKVAIFRLKPKKILNNESKTTSQAKKER